MDNLKTRLIILVVGKTGYGKSYFVKTEIIPRLSRIVILDLLGEYDFPGFVYFTDWQEFQEYMSEHCEQPTLKVICRFATHEEYEFALTVADECENTTIVIEEITHFANARYYTERLEQIIRFGRHRSTSIVGISQRVSDMGPLLLNQTDLLICYQLTDKNDIDRLNSIAFVDGRGEEVANLAQYHAISFKNFN